MATWTTLPDATLEPGKPIRSIDVLALRDNPVAIAEGEVGAPKILDAALGTTVTTAGTDWVISRNAGASAGAIGTYAWARRNGAGDVAFGSTIAGSSLRTTSSLYGQNQTMGQYFLPSPVILSGTWRAMGSYTASVADNTSGIGYGATLWLRIA